VSFLFIKLPTFDLTKTKVKMMVMKTPFFYCEKGIKGLKKSATWFSKFSIRLAYKINSFDIVRTVKAKPTSAIAKGLVTLTKLSTTLSKQLTPLSELIGKLTTKYFTAAKSSVTIAKSSVTRVKSSVTAAKSSVTVAKSFVTSAKSFVTRAKSSVTSAKTSVTSAKTSVTSAKMSVTSSKSSVTRAKSSVTGAKSSVTSAKKLTLNSNFYIHFNLKERNNLKLLSIKINNYGYVVEKSIYKVTFSIWPRPPSPSPRPLKG